MNETELKKKLEEILELIVLLEQIRDRGQKNIFRKIIKAEIKDLMNY